MLVGAHVILYSKNADADRAFLRDVLKLPNVDAGEGWLIFGLPPAEIGIHPGEKNDVHEFYFMVEDAAAFVAEMKKRSIRCKPVVDQGYGLMTEIVLPGGGKLGVYEPRHARPKPMSTRASRDSKPGKSKARSKSSNTKALRMKAGRR